MKTIRIPQNVTLLAGKKVSIKAGMDKKYKDLKRPLMDMFNTVSSLKRQFEKVEKEIEEAVDDLQKGKQPVLGSYLAWHFDNVKNDVKDFMESYSDFRIISEKIENQDD